METFVVILTAVLRVLLPMLFATTTKTSEDGATAPGLRDALHKRIRETWGRGTLVVILCCVVFLGCNNPRTIYVPGGTPVRLRETVTGVQVWVLDNDSKPVEGIMDLPEGWYALPPPDDDVNTP